MKSVFHQTFDEYAYGNNLYENDSEIHRCHKCDRQFKHKKVLARHLRECGQEPKFQCPLCSYKSKRKEHMRHHLASKFHQHDPQAQAIINSNVFYLRQYNFQ